MIETYKVLSGIYDIQVSHQKYLKYQSMLLEVIHWKSPIVDVTTIFGSIHLAWELQMYGTAYRSLSLLPCQSTHLKTDWIKTGHYKNWNTIGKQNYQDRE